MPSIRSGAARCILMARCKPSLGGQRNSGRLIPTGFALRFRSEEGERWAYQFLNIAATCTLCRVQLPRKLPMERGEPAPNLICGDVVHHHTSPAVRESIAAV